MKDHFGHADKNDHLADTWIRYDRKQVVAKKWNVILANQRRCSFKTFIQFPAEEIRLFKVFIFIVPVKIN